MRSEPVRRDPTKVAQHLCWATFVGFLREPFIVDKKQINS
jgi:hypothetical protein